MTRPDNFVYRGVLTHPINLGDGTTAKSVIIKCSVATTYQVFEEALLKSLINLAPLSAAATTVVKTPNVFVFDREANIQILEDLANTDGLKTVLLSPDVGTIVPSPEALGLLLGSWLQAFHEWASAPDQAIVRSQMGQNDRMRKTKYEHTFAAIMRVLGEHPTLLHGYRDELQSVQEAVAKDFERPTTTEGDKYWGLIHGDFWSGK